MLTHHGLAVARQGVGEDLASVEPSYVKMQAAARRVIRAGEADSPDVTVIPEGLAGILDNEAEYLNRMDRIVGLFERQACGGGSRR